jgi:hypothetical protein
VPKDQKDGTRHQAYGEKPFTLYQQRKEFCVHGFMGRTERWVFGKNLVRPDDPDVSAADVPHPDTSADESAAIPPGSMSIISTVASAPFPRFRITSLRLTISKAACNMPGVFESMRRSPASRDEVHDSAVAMNHGQNRKLRPCCTVMVKSQRTQADELDGRRGKVRPLVAGFEASVPFIGGDCS